MPMSSNFLSRSSVVAATFLCAVLTTPSDAAQLVERSPDGRADSPHGERSLRHGVGERGPQQGLPFGIPRVAGLSVVIDSVAPAGAGMAVGFSVQMTTQREVPLSFSIPYTFNTVYPSGGFSGSAVVGSGTFANAVSAFGGGSPQYLGKLDETVTDYQRSSSNNQGTRLYARSSYAPGTTLDFFGNLISAYHYSDYETQVVQRVAGAAPGLDFGDGATVSTTSMPLVSTVSTVPRSVTGAVGYRTRVFRRAGLSHVYADQSPKQITARSGCCSIANFPFGGPESGTTMGTLSRSGTFALDTSARTFSTYVQGNFLASGGQVVSRTATTTATTLQLTSTSFSSSFSSNFQAPFTVDQLNAVAAVGLSTQEIPSLSTIGLGLLALLLGGVGLFLLRRSA